MHVMGHGTPAELAQMAKPAVDLIGTVPASHNGPGGTASSSVQAGSMDTAKLAQIAGHAGEQTGQVYKITVGRDDLQLKEMGATINARMGLNTWAAIFRSHGLSVVAIHQHMSDTRPMVFFLHYWGKGPAADLASGFRAALDQLGKAKTPVSTARR
jgi:hypothetical protein